MTPEVSVVIPTIGRASLGRAVRSALGQSLPVAEIIVVADNDTALSLPSDDRIRVLRNVVGSGPACCRQSGIDAAGGTVIALLDDDDEWHPTKLERQLAAVGPIGGQQWIASSRMDVLGPGNRRRTWPRRTIAPGESVAEYLFRFVGFRVGRAALQTSTLCFPTELARQVRWDAHAGEPHDEPSWLIRAQRAVPDVVVVQLPEVLSTYHVGEASVSRDRSDRSDEYIDWGLRYLASESPRVLGDYLCTSPVSAAVSARSPAGVRRSLRAAFEHGQPGAFAVCYAVLNGLRVVGRSAPVAARA